MIDGANRPADEHSIPADRQRRSTGPERGRFGTGRPRRRRLEGLRAERGEARRLARRGVPRCRAARARRAASSRSATSPSRSGRARSSSSWASPARASRRSSGRSSASSSRPPGTIEIAGQDVIGANAPSLRSCAGIPSRWSSSTSACWRTAASSTTSPSDSKCRASPKRERQATAARDARLVGLEDVRDAVPGPALRRHAAARRRRARVRGQPRGDALRRAVQRARPADPARHAGRGHAAATRRSARR